jgi:hypothetical protein
MSAPPSGAAISVRANFGTKYAAEPTPLPALALPSAASRI